MTDHLRNTDIEAQVDLGKRVALVKEAIRGHKGVRIAHTKAGWRAPWSIGGRLNYPEDTNDIAAAVTCVAICFLLLVLLIPHRHHPTERLIAEFVGAESILLLMALVMAVSRSKVYLSDAALDISRGGSKSIVRRSSIRKIVTLQVTHRTPFGEEKDQVTLLINGSDFLLAGFVHSTWGEEQIREIVEQLQMNVDVKETAMTLDNVLKRFPKDAIDAKEKCQPRAHQDLHRR